LFPRCQGPTAAAESYRVLRTNINFSAIDAPLRTLLVTSSNPGEGKTTTAVNLAFAMAMDGKKVILVDTDLRRPSVGALLGLPNTPGLTDVLAGTADLDSVLMQHGEFPTLMAMSAGSIPPNPSELLNSRSFPLLIKRLIAQADLVIMDSPPVLVAADAQILAAQADGTILVIEPGQTKKAAARQTLGLLRHARAKVLGITYNKMRQAGHGGYYGAYYYQESATPRLSGGKKNGKAAKALVAAAEAEEK
jgi:capsular exopolysaccharide synthesis family protein